MSQSMQTLLAPFNIQAPAIEIRDLVLDSRDVAIHKGFLAITGHQRDGRDFIPQAISLGAKVILAETADERQHGQMEMRGQSLIIHFYQLSQNLSALGVAFYDHPADKMAIVGITGTNGKTSTAQICSQIGQLMGVTSGSIGTLGAGICGELTSTINTTPDAISMQRLLHGMEQKGVKLVALEASSHALVQHRIQDLKTDVAVFTNLTRDHLDYHGSMQEYAQAKRKLLHQPDLKWAVINHNDVESQNWLNELPLSVPGVLYGMGMPDTSWTGHFCVATQVEYLTRGLRVNFSSSWGDGQFESQLLGEFNVSNILAGIASQLCLDTPVDDIINVVPTLTPVDGRMELFNQAGYASVVVDYAHTPDALEQTLKAVRKHSQGQVWCVFGCGGDRDQGKRLLMGEVAERLADRVMLTNDNSRSEDPEKIINDILKGCRAPEGILKETDRQQAIRRVMKLANEQDIVLVAGKGHEDYQIIGEQNLPYNEREFIAQFLKGKQQ